MRSNNRPFTLIRQIKNIQMKKLRIHYLQHVEFEDPGCIAHWVQSKGHQLSATKLYIDQSFPEIDSIDWLIIMGGPMSVNDAQTIEWINAEKEFVAKAIQAGKTVIGICLGSQFIASALGAKVYKNDHKEIGWLPIVSPEGTDNLLFNDELEFNVFHWHGETFDLPEEAQLLGSSIACRNQAFLYKENVLGLQFHFEVTEESLQQMLDFGVDDIDGTIFTQSADLILSRNDLIPANNKRMYRILDYFEQK